MANLQELEQLQTDMKQASGNDDTFGEIIDRAMDLLCLLDKDVSHQLGVSRPTVNRWRNGVVVPHPLMRPAIFAFFAKRCEEVRQSKVQRAKERNKTLVARP